MAEEKGENSQRHFSIVQTEHGRQDRPGHETREGRAKRGDKSRAKRARPENGQVIRESEAVGREAKLRVWRGLGQG